MRISDQKYTKYFIEMSHEAKEYYARAGYKNAADEVVNLFLTKYIIELMP